MDLHFTLGLILRSCVLTNSTLFLATGRFFPYQMNCIFFTVNYILHLKSIFKLSIGTCDRDLPQTLISQCPKFISPLLSTLIFFTVKGWSMYLQMF